MSAGPPEPGAGRRELILYATPTGPLAAVIDGYYAAVEAELEPTTAQAYPPHCTLTGFFRRDDPGTAAAVESIGRAVAEAGPVPDGAVEIVGLVADQRWVGLELRSPWLLDLTASIAAHHPPAEGDDALRLKDWLHLSLAYGVDDLASHARLAAGRVDTTLACGWEVALWERHGPGSWSRLTEPAGARTGGPGSPA